MYFIQDTLNLTVIGEQVLTIRKKMSLESKLLATSRTKQADPEDRLARLTKRENEVIQDIKAVLDALKPLMVRVKMDGVREQVEKMGTLFEELLKKRSEIKSEYRVIRAGDKTKAETLFGDSKTLDRVAASETRILEALKAVSMRMDTHEKQINKMVSTKDPCSEAQQLGVRPDHSGQRW